MARDRALRLRRSPRSTSRRRRSTSSARPRQPPDADGVPRGHPRLRGRWASRPRALRSSSASRSAAGPAAGRGSSQSAWFRPHEAAGARGTAGRLGAEHQFDLVVGLGTLGAKRPDPDKEIAACVYLWTRNPALCNGPGTAGPRFNTDLVEGQLGSLRRGDGLRRSATRESRRRDRHGLTRVTGDRQAAFTALSERAAGSLKLPTRAARSWRPSAIIGNRFGGSRAATGRARARGRRRDRRARRDRGRAARGRARADRARDARPAARSATTTRPSATPRAGRGGQARTVVARQADARVAVATVAPAQVFSLRLGGQGDEDPDARGRPEGAAAREAGSRSRRSRSRAPAPACTRR